MTATKTQKKSTKVNSFVVQKYIFIAVLLLIPIVNWALFWLTVNISSIGLAFQDQRTGVFTWRNFKDFWDIISKQDGELYIALINTFKYFFIGLFITTPLSLIVAYFIYKKIAWHRFFLIVFYLPCIISGLVMVKVYTEFLLPNGPLSQLFNLSIPPEGMFARSTSATPAIIVYTIWTGIGGGNMLLFIGAMSRVPIEVLESAKLEGCGPFREIVSIIAPLIWPTISTMIILSFTGIFGASGPILLFGTDGKFKTMTLSFWIFKQVYGIGEFGGSGSYNLVSATGLCFTLVGVPIILLTHWLVEKVPSVEY